jgi:hypothetical protein
VISAGEAVRRALPAEPLVGDREFRLAVFGLARRLKAVPEFSAAELPGLRATVGRWYTLARPHLEGRTFTDVWAEFTDAWPAVRYASGNGPVEAAWAAALAGPPPPEAGNYDDARVGLLIAFCRQLQAENGETFFLGGRTAAELLGVTQPTAAKWLKMLAADRLLRVVKAGSQVDHLATEYTVRPPAAPAVRAAA